MEVENLVLKWNRWILVRIQNRERRAEIRNRILGALEIISAYGYDFSVLRSDGIVVFGQINELGTAFGSPERPIEHQHDVFLTDVRRQLDGWPALGIWQCEVMQARAKPRQCSIVAARNRPQGWLWRSGIAGLRRRFHRRCRIVHGVHLVRRIRGGPG